MRFWNTTINRLLPAIFLTAFTITVSFGQENSPYSRYGLGNLKQTENVIHRGMGGVCIADENPLACNPNNPASFAGLRLTAYQVGLEGVRVNVRNDSLSNRTGTMGLSYLNIGFPVNKHLGFSFGLSPFTRGKYGMQQSDSLPGISKVLYNYYGGGGVQQIYVGAAYKFRHISFGLSTGYTFGNVVRTSEANFIDTLKIISSNISGRTNVGGVFLQLGTLISQTIKGETRVTFGATYQLAQNLNAKKETYWKSFIGDVLEPSYEYKVDSVVELKGKVRLPARIGLGLMLSQGEMWKAGLDFVSANWSNYRYYDQADSTGQYWMLKLGGAITPEANTGSQLWKRLTYRAGAYIGKDIFRFRQTSLPVNGVTVGLGYPVRRTNMSIGQINASLDLGKRGTLDQGLLSEGYTRFTIGVTLNDKWFIPRKYE